MKKGIFISIEGPDGSGKSTQLKNIEKYFSDKKIDVVFTREPGGTAIGERIRNIILDNECSEMSYMTEALLYAASRAQHVSQVILPAIRSGKVVVCDRYVDSSIAYQGYGRELGDAVSNINSYATLGLMPDVTILMKLNPEIGKSRIAVDGQDRLEKEKNEFHNRVYEGYLAIEKQYPDRIFSVDASLSIEEIRDRIYNKLDSLLEFSHRAGE